MRGVDDRTGTSEDITGSTHVVDAPGDLPGLPVDAGRRAGGLRARWLPAESLKLRIAWGGGAERIWQGKISLSEGRLDQPHPLGIEADEPGSMWIQDGALVFRQRSPRTYDGVDLLVQAPLSAKLTIQMASPGETKTRPGSRCRYPACWRGFITPISTRAATGC